MEKFPALIDGQDHLATLFESLTVIAASPKEGFFWLKKVRARVSDVSIVEKS